MRVGGLQHETHNGSVVRAYVCVYVEETKQEKKSRDNVERLRAMLTMLTPAAVHTRSLATRCPHKEPRPASALSGYRSTRKSSQ